MVAMPQIKGISFINRHEFLVERFGEAGLARVLAAVKPETAHALRTSSAVDWLPLEMLVDLDLAIVNGCFDGDLAKARIIGEYNLNQAVSRVYKPLMRLLNAGTVVKRSVAIWGKIVQGPVFSSRQDGPRGAVIELTEFNPLHRIYCQVLIGGFEGVLHACGEKNVVVDHPHCVLDGAKSCSFTIRW
jgi:hypothetical protein